MRKRDCEKQVGGRLDDLTPALFQSCAACVISEQDLRPEGFVRNVMDNRVQSRAYLLHRGLRARLFECLSKAPNCVVAHTVPNCSHERVAIVKALIEVAIGDSGARTNTTHRHAGPALLSPNLATSSFKCPSPLDSTLVCALACVCPRSPDYRHSAILTNRARGCQSAVGRLQIDTEVLTERVSSCLVWSGVRKG